MARNDYTLDGVPLRDPEGRWFAERLGTSIRGIPSRVSNNLTYPGVDGELFNPGAEFEAGIVPLRLYIEGATHEQFMENYEFIVGVVAQRHKALELIHHYGSDESSDRVALVEFPDSSEPQLDGPLRAQIDLNARVIGSFWRSTAPTDFTTNRESSFVTSLSGGNAPVIDALIRVKGGFGDMTITDPVSGSQLRIRALLGENEYIIIDPLAWTARKVTTDTWEGGTNVDNLVESNQGRGSMFHLAPQRNGSSLVYQVNLSSVNPVGTPSVTIRAKKSYL